MDHILKTLYALIVAFSFQLCVFGFYVASGENPINLKLSWKIFAAVFIWVISFLNEPEIKDKMNRYRRSL